MTNRHWRELVEIVGVLGIVAAMLLVAAELRESNRIAAAQAAVQVSAQYHRVNLYRAVDPDVAKLFPKLEAPEAHLITATEASQIRAIAAHYINAMGAVRVAYKDDLISAEARDNYIREFRNTIDTWPGLQPYYVDIYENRESIQGVKEYLPIADFIASQPDSETAAED